jgi:hypothetical protein
MEPGRECEFGNRPTRSSARAEDRPQPIFHPRDVIQLYRSGVLRLYRDCFLFRHLLLRQSVRRKLASVSSWRSKVSTYFPFGCAEFGMSVVSGNRFSSALGESI